MPSEIISQIKSDLETQFENCEKELGKDRAEFDNSFFDVPLMALCVAKNISFKKMKKYFPYTGNITEEQYEGYAQGKIDDEEYFNRNYNNFNLIKERFELFIFREKHNSQKAKIQSSEIIPQGESEKLFGTTKEKFLNQVEKVGKNSNKEDVIFTLKKDDLKHLIRPIRKYLKYKLTEDAYVNINCDKKRLKKITLYFDNPESSKTDEEKHIVIYSSKVYESKTLSEKYRKTFESKDQKLQELAQAMFKNISEKLDDIFGKKKTTYVPLQEKFKKRLF